MLREARRSTSPPRRTERPLRSSAWWSLLGATLGSARLGRRQPCMFKGTAHHSAGHVLRWRTHLRDRGGARYGADAIGGADRGPARCLLHGWIRSYAIRRWRGSPRFGGCRELDRCGAGKRVGPHDDSARGDRGGGRPWRFAVGGMSASGRQLTATESNRC
jgi:hypothetical protein